MPYTGPRLRNADGLANALGQRVAERRGTLKLKQDELCGQIAAVTEGKWNPSWADISRLENGARLVTDNEIKVLAKVLDCSAAWLLLGDDLRNDKLKQHGS